VNAHRSCETISVLHVFLLSSVVGMVLRSCAQDAAHPQDIPRLHMELAQRDKPLCWVCGPMLLWSGIRSKPHFSPSPYTIRGMTAYGDEVEILRP
jgi:hypothetical protein